MILRPSAGERWGPGACPASPTMEALFPEADSVESREGTAAHHYGASMLQGEIVTVGDLAPNGVPIDQDMIDGGNMLVNEVNRILALCSPSVNIYVEQHLTMHGLIHPKNEGTPDVQIVDYIRHAIYNIDYKYGHRYVEVFRNWQFVDYTAGAVEAICLDKQEFIGWHVENIVVQPRFYAANPVRRHVYLGWQMWALFEELAHAAELAMSPNPPTKTGPYCRDCNACFACPAKAALDGELMEYSGQCTPHDITPDAAGRELRELTFAIERLTARHTALSAYVEAQVRAGVNVPWWAMDHSEGSEEWAQSVDEVIALGDAFGKDFRKPVAVITPTQAKKLGVDGGVISAYSRRKAGKGKLKLVDSSTPAKAFS